jgi:hypothetical protein
MSRAGNWPDGLRRIARRVRGTTYQVAEYLSSPGFPITSDIITATGSFYPSSGSGIDHPGTASTEGYPVDVEVTSAQHRPGSGLMAVCP